MIVYLVLLLFTIFMIYKIYKYYIHKNTIDSLNVKQKKFLTTLTDMADILENNDIHYFLLGGTALGCHREKKFIEHDTDIDLGVFEDENFDFIKKIVEKSSKFKYLNGYPNNTNVLNHTEICFKHKETNIKIDIFKFYKKGDKYMSMAYGGKCSFKPRKRCEWIDPINLIKMNFLGRFYNVPDMNYIKSQYGEDWYIPKIESYDEKKSIIN